MTREYCGDDEKSRGMMRKVARRQLGILAFAGMTVIWFMEFGNYGFKFGKYY
jgi:hypothetical protein